jgi:hypothetical protein
MAQGRKGKQVLVVLQRRLFEPRANQGLRAAVAYAAMGLQVTVALCALKHESDPMPMPVKRHIQTLRALGHRVLTIAAQSDPSGPDPLATWAPLCELLKEAAAQDATVVVW